MEEKHQGPFETDYSLIDSNSGTNAKGEADPRNDGWSKIFLPRVGANWGDTHASGSPDPIGLRETANYELSQSSLPVDGSYDVLLRLDPAQRTQRDDVMQIDLPAQSGRVLAPLSQVARVEKGTAPSKIRRRDLMREIRISANAQGRSLGEVIADIQQGRE